MDLATIVGIVICALLILSSILLGGSPIIFLNMPSVLIVVGGTIGTTLIRNPLADVIGMVQVVSKAFSIKLVDPRELIVRIVEFSRKARKEGMLSLENVDCGYDYLQKGITLAVDGLEQEEIKAILTNDLQGMVNRHKRGKEILDGMGQAAPAFGMIGTLIGLVQMLADMADPSTIGPAMAVALLTTLYGALIANVVCIPLADKLRMRSREEVLAMSICLEGVVCLSQGDNPSAIEQKLKAFLSPKAREGKSAEKQTAAEPEGQAA
jgi:chemotaxis protein MotA